MTRPLDWGDKNPSDIGDTLPLSPISGFTEIDYTIEKVSPKEIKVPRDTVFVVPDNKSPTPEPRSTFQGIIVEKIPPQNDPITGNPLPYSPQKYYVLREDGKRIIGETFGNDANYNDFEEGDPVVLTAAPENNRWWLSGHIKTRFEPVLELSIQQDSIPSDQVQKVEFSVVDTDTTQEYSDRIPLLIPLGNGDVKCLQDDYGLFDISFSVAVEYIASDDDEDDPDKVKAGVWCPSNRTVDNADAIFDILRFDKATGFIKYFINEGQKKVVTLSLNGGNTNYVLHQPAGGQQAEWVGDLDLAGAVKVGKQLAQGWLKLENNGGNYVWHGHGKRNLKYLWPNNEAKNGSHIMCEVVNGEAVQLKHSAQGGDGEIKAYDCSNVCQTWKVKDGLIISGPGINAPSGSGTVVIDDRVTQPYRPCV